MKRWILPSLLASASVFAIGIQIPNSADPYLANPFVSFGDSIFIYHASYSSLTSVDSAALAAVHKQCPTCSIDTAARIICQSTLGAVGFSDTVGGVKMREVFTGAANMVVNARFVLDEHKKIQVEYDDLGVYMDTVTYTWHGDACADENHTYRLERWTWSLDGNGHCVKGIHEKASSGSSTRTVQDSILIAWDGDAPKTMYRVLGDTLDMASIEVDAAIHRIVRIRQSTKSGALWSFRDSVVVRFEGGTFVSRSAWSYSSSGTLSEMEVQAHQRSALPSGASTSGIRRVPAASRLSVEWRAGSLVASNPSDQVAELRLFRLDGAQLGAWRVLAGANVPLRGPVGGGMCIWTARSAAGIARGTVPLP